MNILKRKILLITVLIIVLFIILIIITTGKLFSQDGTIVDRLKPGQDKDSTFPYELTNPTNKFKLPHYLDEISGISYVQENKLACIQDERGTIYLFDIDKEKVTGKYNFGEEKDFEDIKIVGNTAYVLQSNGNIWEVNDFEKENSKIKRYKTSLSAQNDAEGLAFDYESNSLLIACKGSPHLKKKSPALKGKKAIYQFDLYTKELSQKPTYVIDLQYITDLITHTSSPKVFMEVNKIFDLKKNDVNFQPSGIAVHPITKNIYLISSVDNMLLILDRAGKIIAAQKLNGKIFKQPEGICFNPVGDLFMSNESKDGRANILKFKYIQKNQVVPLR